MTWVFDVVALIGVGFIVAGVAWLDLRAGLIVAGISLVTIGYLGAGVWVSRRRADEMVKPPPVAE